MRKEKKKRRFSRLFLSVSNARTENEMIINDTNLENTMLPSTILKSTVQNIMLYKKEKGAILAND